MCSPPKRKNTMCKCNQQLNLYNEKITNFRLPINKWVQITKENNLCISQLNIMGATSCFWGGQNKKRNHISLVLLLQVKYPYLRFLLFGFYLLLVIFNLVLPWTILLRSLKLGARIFNNYDNLKSYNFYFVHSMPRNAPDDNNAHVVRWI